MNLTRAKNRQNRQNRQNRNDWRKERPVEHMESVEPMGPGWAAQEKEPYKQRDAYFLVEDDNGGEPRWFVFRGALESEFNGFTDAFGTHRMVDGDKGQEAYAWDVPAKQSAWTRRRKSVQFCAYTACDDFLSHILGLKMCWSDKDWYEGHPLTTTNGLPYQHTITLLSDLVGPYGLAVSRVCVTKRVSLCDEQREWMQVLGCNPAALVDRDMSNAEYAAMMPPFLREKTLIECDAYRFEFTDSLPVGPWVLFKGVAPGTPGAGGGGHAAYCGPRDRPLSWAIALQFDWKRIVTHHAPAPTLAYEEQWIWDFALMDSKDPSGKTVRSLIDKHRPTYSYPKTWTPPATGGNACHTDGDVDGYGRPRSQQGGTSHTQDSLWKGHGGYDY